MPNIGAWEKLVAEKYKLHASWLVSSYYGEKCPCCGKVRRYEYYITDMGVCVFCSAACKDGDKCQQSPFFEKD